VDNPQKPLTVLSLCTGYGGIEKGLELAGLDFTVVADVEIESFATTNLVKEMEKGWMDPSVIWTNLKTLPLEPFRGAIDILTGGYPCQPFSRAGRRQGSSDERHLWPYIRRAIDVIRPGWCFFENVEGHITEGLFDVLDDLGGLGYTHSWGIFSAAECGFNHQRERVFILAHPNGYRSQMPAKITNDQERIESYQDGVWSDYLPAPEGHLGVWTHEGFESEPLLLRGDDGLASWEDRIRLLGNGVVPHTAARAFRYLMTELMANE